MAEVAGLVLSVLSLYSACVSGYNQVVTARNIGKDAAHILCKLEVEEARFLAWGGNIGLTPDPHSQPRILLKDIPTVTKALAQIKSLLTDADTLKRRYGLQAEASEPTANPSKDSGGSSSTPPSVRQSWLGGVFIGNEEFSRASLISRLQTQMSLGRKLRWSSGDKEALWKLASELKSLNDSLESLLRDAQLRQFQSDFAAFCLNAASTTNDLSRLRVLRDASSTDYEQMSLAAQHKITRLELEAEFCRRVNMGPIASSSDSPATATPRPEDVEIPTESVTLLNVGAQRSLANHRQFGLVLVEWRAFDDQETGWMQDMAILRVRHLAILLHRNTPKPNEFRVLPCHGFILDTAQSRFGMVFQMPPAAPPAAIASAARSHPEMPCSLYDLLASASRDTAYPSQSSRMTLARRLATSLLHLHATGWLHKGVRSHNILFFGDGTTPSPASPLSVAKNTGSQTKASCVSRLIEKPFLTGFGYSRLSGLNSVSITADPDPIQELYRHPDVQALVPPGAQGARERFKKRYDAYSLGLVLVEIGCWRPLDTLLSKKRSARDNLEKLLRNVVDNGDLAYWMGGIYAGVVEKCLRCEWGQQQKWRTAPEQRGEFDEPGEESFHLEFLMDVVQKLDSCHV